MPVLTINHHPTGWHHNWHWRDQRLIPPQPPSPSLVHGFESDSSSLSTASSVSLQSDKLEGSLHSWCGRQHRETRAHMKINLPVFKDEDAKDTITYQSWRWDLTVYHHERCWDCTFLPYAIWSLQGYHRELVRSLGWITLDDVLTILDEHYNNVKVLDALNQELFQLQMADKETVSDWVICLSRHLHIWLLCFQNASLPTMWQSWNVTTFMEGYQNVLKPWWPTSRPAHRKRLISITYGPQGKQRRRTPWNYPKAPKAKQPVTQPNLRWLVSSPCKSLKGPRQ